MRVLAWPSDDLGIVLGNRLLVWTYDVKSCALDGRRRMGEQPAYKWMPIKDLGDWKDLENSELRALSHVWDEQRELLEKNEKLQEFSEQLQRRWAIETGIIERLYTLDRGITQLLIERGIDASLIPDEATDRDPQLVALMIQDHEEAVQGLFDFVRGDRQLTTSYVKELHALITRHQESTLAVNTLGRQTQVPLERGVFKKLPNNPVRPDGSVHEYCPPEQTDSEMDRLIALHGEHMEVGVPPEVEAAWLHHRFAQIHPFQDGNGRVARALATLVFLRAGWFPLVVTRDDRTRYIGALEEADREDLAPLVELFSALQRKAFVNALGVAGDVLRRERVEHVIDAAREVFERRREALLHEWEKALTTARSLQELTRLRLEEIQRKLQAELGEFSPAYRFYVDNEPDGGDRGYYFRWQIIETAKKLDYYANPATYRAWTRLVMRTETQAEILVSFHGIGHEFRGLLAVSTTFFRREETESGERELADLTPISDEVFQINYREDPGQARERFDRWLDHGLLKAMDMWRERL